MEISELLRRGNFSRSQIFQSYQQGSQNSLVEQDNISNANNSKSPMKGKLASKGSMNNTKNTDISYSSQNGRDKFFIIRKNNSKEGLGRGMLKNSSQISLNDESLINMQNTYKNKANQSSGAYFQIFKSETQFSNNIDEDTQIEAQILQQQKKKTHHKKIVSMDYRTSGQNEILPKRLLPQSQQTTRRNQQKLSVEKEKLQEILTKSTAFTQPKQLFQSRSQNGSITFNYGQHLGSTNSQSNKKEQLQSMQPDQQPQRIESPVPKTAKQNIFQDSTKHQVPYFSSVKVEQQFNNTTNNFKNLLKDLSNDYIKKDNYLNTSDQNINSTKNEQKNQINFRNTISTKQFKSQDKYSEQNPSYKNVSSKINPFSSTSSTAAATKDMNKKSNTKIGSKLSQRNLQIGNMKSPIQEFFEDKEQFKKAQSDKQITRKFSSKGTESIQIENQQELQDDAEKKQKMNINFKTFVNLVKIKKKVVDLVKKNLESNKQSGESSSDSDRQGNKHNNSKYQSHKNGLINLKQEEGCDVHDIYGTFNDKIKQIQDQLYEAIQNYQLAYTIIEHVEKEKNQSRVIDTVENTIQCIFISLDFLEKIPNHINEREEIDKILSQQAITIMKSTQANLVIQIETVMIYAKYCKAICNFGKALRLYKQCKNMSISPLMQRYRMKSYKSIGQCFSNLKLYNMSLVYFGKYLECAWYLGDTDAELQAYDLIGMTHYLLGDLETAKFYHEKMIQNDNEPAESDVKSLNSKKIVEKLKKLNTEEYIQKMAVSYKKFFAKIHSIDYEEDYECSSSDDEFKISIPKTSSQKKNQDYEQYMRELSPNAKKKLESEKKRFIAIYNAEDRFAQLQIKQQANQNIRMLEYKRMAFQLPPQLKYTSAKSFKPINSTQKFPFRINQFSINRNLDNYLAQDQRILKYLNFDFYKLVEDSNDKKLKHKIVQILSKFQNNLIFALSQIHCLRERDKYKQNKRRFAFSGVADFNKPNNLTIMNINFSQEKMQQTLEEKKKLQPQEDRSKPNSNKQKFLFIQRFQMHPEVDAYFKK